jgi:hypothetical protein
MANQIMRAKLRALRKTGGSLFGPKKVLTAHEIERRKSVAEHARCLYELLKATQLSLDALNFRASDIRLTAAEYELSGITLDDARRKFQAEKMQSTLFKCIKKLSEHVAPFAPELFQPVIGLTPDGRRRPVRISFWMVKIYSFYARNRMNNSRQ